MISPEEINPLPNFRSFENSDADAIAHYYNLNLQTDKNIWCQGKPTTPQIIKRHAMLLGLRGKKITQVHTENNTFLSYFGGYKRGDSTRFTIAIVNLDIPDPFTLFQTDAAHAFELALRNGSLNIKLSGSSDEAGYVKWAEEAVGMNRSGTANLWTANNITIAKYINRILHPMEVLQSQEQQEPHQLFQNK